MIPSLCGALRFRAPTRVCDPLSARRWTASAATRTCSSAALTPSLQHWPVPRVPAACTLSLTSAEGTVGCCRSALRARVAVTMRCRSMYRFNGEDGRLNRILDLAVLVMEARARVRARRILHDSCVRCAQGFLGFESKFDYCIVGHSGDSDWCGAAGLERAPVTPGRSIKFVDYGPKPTNRKQRLSILHQMSAHAQFCQSGDNTVEATARAIRDVASLTGDHTGTVIVVSDANLRRYGIAPATFGAWRAGGGGGAASCGSGRVTSDARRARTDVRRSRRCIRVFHSLRVRRG